MEIQEIQPQGARCLIKPFQHATTSSSGLVMENTSNETAAPSRGTIVSVGDESKYKEGDEVLFVRYSSYIISAMTPEGKKDVYIIEDEDVLATVTKGRIRNKPNKQTNARRTS